MLALQDARWTSVEMHLSADVGKTPPFPFPTPSPNFSICPSLRKENTELQDVLGFSKLFDDFLIFLKTSKISRRF